MLIYSAGYDYPRLAAYLPGMRDILNARLERAADFIVQQGTEATENGSWSVNFEELERGPGSRCAEETVWTGCCWRRSHAAGKWPRRR